MVKTLESLPTAFETEYFLSGITNITIKTSKHPHKKGTNVSKAIKKERKLAGEEDMKG